MSDPNHPQPVPPESTWDDARITAYVLGELTSEETRAFEDRLAQDSELAAAVEEARGVTDELTELFADEVGAGLEDNRRDEIIHASSGESVELSKPASRRRWIAIVMAAAAALLIALGMLPAKQSAWKAPGEKVAQTPSAVRQAVRLTPLGETPTDEFLADAELADLQLESLTAEALKAEQQEKFVEFYELYTKQSSPPSEAASTQPILSKNPMQYKTSKMINGRAIDYEFMDESSVPKVVFEADSKTTVTLDDGIQDRRHVTEFYAIAPKLKKKLDGEADFVSPPVMYPDAKMWEELSWRTQNRDRFDPIVENDFRNVRDEALSTFSIDVDTASYSKVRRFLVGGSLPRPDAVRIEEMVNYFDYAYDAPAKDDEHPFQTDVTIASCPWKADHRLARIAIQGKRIDRQSRPPCNLVFLLDTSGSMKSANKLPLVIQGMKMLAEELTEKDRVAIVVYAGSAGLVLESTPAGKQRKIRKALERLSAGGSTNGGAGIQLAYATARDHFIKDGVNRVILCTDGDFNVGLSGTDELVSLVKKEAAGGTFLSVLGFGMGNHNDAMLEQISGKGNGNYAFIDTANEAHKVLVRQTNATLVTIAKDVKIQIEFNPRKVARYRLIGYENRVMANQDFNDDKKDAGEIGAGHQVTALYEIVPASAEESDASGEGETKEEAVDPLRYQSERKLTEAAGSDESITVKLRYKQPDGDESTLIELQAADDELAFNEADRDFRFAAAVASFGMKLRRSVHAGDWTMSDISRTAEDCLGGDEYGLRGEFLELVGKAAALAGE